MKIYQVLQDFTTPGKPQFRKGDTIYNIPEETAREFEARDLIKEIKKQTKKDEPKKQENITK